MYYIEELSMSLSSSSVKFTSFDADMFLSKSDFLVSAFKF